MKRRMRYNGLMAEGKTVVLYHADCPDGFGGAYAAWKKLGDAADYIPVKHGKPPPEGFVGATVYFIDFCYPKETMDAIVSEAGSVTVLDHHEGMKEVVESMSKYAYDAKRSGATIAWGYFHPGVPAPTLLKYVEDGDLYKFVLPYSRAVLGYVYSQPFEFAMWENLMKNLENAEEREKIIARGIVYSEHFAHLVESIMKKAELVRFEGYDCYLAGASSEFTSDVGNGLARAKPPLALILNARADVIHVSLRSVDDADVSAIARKYGGNGHPRAAAFRIRYGDPLPWTPIEKK